MADTLCHCTNAACVLNHCYCVADEMCAAHRMSMYDFMRRRKEHKVARKYTVVVGGVEHNAGEFRDNMLDVIEELSDVHNIAVICLKRLANTVDSNGAASRLAMLMAQADQLACDAIAIRNRLPEAMTFDDEVVLGSQTPKRIVTLEEVGLDTVASYGNGATVSPRANAELVADAIRQASGSISRPVAMRNTHLSAAAFKEAEATLLESGRIQRIGNVLSLTEVQQH